MASIDEQCKHITNVLTKKDGPQTGRELAVKLDKRYPGNKYDDARTFGRAIARLLRTGTIVKSGARSRPKYAKS